MILTAEKNNNEANYINANCIKKPKQKRTKSERTQFNFELNSDANHLTTAANTQFDTGIGYFDDGIPLTAFTDSTCLTTDISADTSLSEGEPITPRLTSNPSAKQNNGDIDYTIVETYDRPSAHIDTLQSDTHSTTSISDKSVVMTRHAYGVNRSDAVLPECSADRPYINIGKLHHSSTAVVSAASLPRNFVDTRTTQSTSATTPVTLTTPNTTPHSTCSTRPLRYVDFKQFDGSDDCPERRTFLSGSALASAAATGHHSFNNNTSSVGQSPNYTNVTPRRASSTEDYMLMTGSSSSSSGGPSHLALDAHSHPAHSTLGRKRVSTVSGVVGRAVRDEFAVSAVVHSRSHSECLEYPSSGVDSAGYLRMTPGPSPTPSSSTLAPPPAAISRLTTNSNAEHYVNRPAVNQREIYVNQNNAFDSYVNGKAASASLTPSSQPTHMISASCPFENLVSHEHHTSSSRLTSRRPSASSEDDATSSISSHTPSRSSSSSSKPSLLSRLIRRNSSKKAAQAAQAAVAAVVAASPPVPEAAILPPSMLASVSESRNDKRRTSNVYHPVPGVCKTNTTRSRRSSHDNVPSTSRTPSTTPNTARRRFTGPDILSRVPPAPRRQTREETPPPHKATPPVTMAPPIPRRVSTSSDCDQYVCMTPGTSLPRRGTASTSSNVTSESSCTSAATAPDPDRSWSRSECVSRIHSAGGVLLLRDTSSSRSSVDSGVRVINSDFDSLRIVDSTPVNHSAIAHVPMTAPGLIATMACSAPSANTPPPPVVPMKTYRRSKSHPLNQTPSTIATSTSNTQG